MTFLRGRRVWTRQPQSPVKINRADQLADGLVFAFDAGCGMVDLVSGRPANTLGSGVSRGVGPYGVEMQFSGTVADGACSFGAHQGLSGATEATWDVLVKFNSASPSANVFAQWDTNQDWLLQVSSGTLVWVAADDNSGNRRRWGNNSPFFPSAGWYRIIASWQGGANAAFLLNGVDRSAELAVVNAVATSIGTTMDNLQIGTTNSGSDLNGSVVFARAWKRGLTLSAMRRLHEYPQLIYAP